MAPRTGTLSLDMLLRETFVSAQDFGLDRIQPVIQASVDAYNMRWREMIGGFLEVGTESQRIQGGNNSGEMQEINEFSRTPTQVAGLGSTVGFPLRKFGYALGWTNEWFNNNSPADMAQQTLNAQASHWKKLTNETKKAFYVSGNYTYKDIYTKGIDLGVKRLANADGQPIPDGPNNEVFDGATHTHYIDNSSLTDGYLLSTVNTVREHSPSTQVEVAINAANQTAVENLASFKPFVDSRFTINQAASEPVQRLQYEMTNNYPIGYFGGSTVWVRSWAIEDYAVAIDRGATQRALFLRERKPGDSDLRLVADIPMYPLMARYYESLFGVGVWNRVAAAVLDFGASGTYRDPSI